MQQIDRGLQAAAAFHTRLQAAGELQALAPEIARAAAARLGRPLSGADVLRAAACGPGLDALEAFTGQWQGRWGVLPVWHCWEPPVAAPPGLRVQPWTLARLQRAWVGDGHGYNLEVVHAARPSALVLLGAVFHLEPPPSCAVAYLTPHLGIALGPGQLVWLTPAHLFVERVDEAAGYRISQLAWTRTRGRVRLAAPYETTYRRPLA